MASSDMPNDGAGAEPAATGRILSLLRSVGAWLVACIASGAFLVMTMVFSAYVGETISMPQVTDVAAVFTVSLFIAFFVAVFTALIWPPLVFLARWAKTPRGWTDLVLGGLMGAGIIEAISQPAQTGAPLLSVIFASAGATGGIVYWLVAGRPR